MRSISYDERGQFAIEAVLLMVVMLSIFIASTNALRDGKFLAKLVGNPWEQVAGMIECGVWAPPKTACKSLPSQPDRNISLDPRK